MVVHYQIHDKENNMSRPLKRGFNTRLSHAELPYLMPHSHVMPLYNTSAYAVESLDPSDEDKFPFKYARIAHPNGIELECTLASLEEGEAAVVMADGMRAISVTCTSLLSQQKMGTIISTQPLYSDTYSFFKQDMPAFGRECFFLDAAQSPEDQLRVYIDQTRPHVSRYQLPPIDFIFIETPANPTLAMFDIQKLSAIAHEHNIPVVVDSTFATPYNQRPLSLGADIVIHSLTKYCCGHGDALGGAIIGPKKFIKHMRNRMRREGGHMNPDAASRIQRGLRTLGLRMVAHNHNALLLARFLASEKNKISTVHYPGLLTHPQHAIAKAQMRTPSDKPGFGGMVSFELIRPEWIKPFYKYLGQKTFMTLAVSLGSTDSTFSVPALQIHGGLSSQERKTLGISDTLIRFSVGIEEFSDIKHAMASALKQLS